MHKTKEAGAKVAVTVAAAVVWGLMLWAARGAGTAAQFYSGYLMEWVLSLDNLMAISMVFAYFKLPKDYEPRILTVGIASTIVFRLLFTLVGTELLGRPMEVILGVLVGVTAWKMIKNEGEDNAKMVDHNSRWYIRSMRRWFPVTPDVSRPVFFKEAKDWGTNAHTTRWLATPLLACLVAVETTDLMFSFDSVPTVIAVSRTPLVIYSAMIFAIVGLRQLYFLMQETQKYLTKMPRAINIVLVFIALKSIITGLTGRVWPPTVLMVAVFGTLGVGLYYSLKEARREIQQKGP